MIFPFFTELNQIVQSRVLLLLVDKTKMTVSVHTEIAIIVTLFVKLWDGNITSVRVKKHNFHWV